LASNVAAIVVRPLLIFNIFTYCKHEPLKQKSFNWPYPDQSSTYFAKWTKHRTF